MSEHYFTLLYFKNSFFKGKNLQSNQAKAGSAISSDRLGVRRGGGGGENELWKLEEG